MNIRQDSYTVGTDSHLHNLDYADDKGLLWQTLQHAQAKPNNLALIEKKTGFTISKDKNQGDANKNKQQCRIKLIAGI